MGERFRYSGAVLLEEEAVLGQGPDSASPAALLKRAQLLRGAIEKGVSMADGLASLGLLVEQLEAVLAVESNLEFGEHSWLKEIHSLLSSEPLSKHISMLAAAQQWSAWTVLDLTYAGTITDPDSTHALESALAFVSALGTSGPFTLSRFCQSRFTIQLTETTQSLAEALGRALPLAQDEETLAALKTAEFEFGIQYARTMRNPAPADERLIGRLELLASELTLRFGGDVFCADPSGMDDASKEQMRTERHELLDRLDGLLTEEVSEAWTHGFVAFVRGRIFLGTGELERGRQAMKEALDLGFAPYQSGLHLAFAASRLRLRDEVKSSIEQLALRLLVRKGTLSHRYETMARLYFQVGGNPDQVGGTEWLVLAPLLTENRRRKEELMPRLEEASLATREAFRRECLQHAEVLLGETLQPEDVDSYLRREDSSDRFLRLSRGEASVARLDELPELKISASILARGVERGIGTHDLVEQLLGHMHALEEAGQPLGDLLGRFACLAGSFGFARSHIEESLLEGAPEAVRAFKTWASVGRLGEESKIELHAFLRGQLEIREARQEADELSEWFAKRVGTAGRSAVVVGILPNLFRELAETSVMTAQMGVIDRILELTGEEEETHNRIVDWATPLVLDSTGKPTASRQTQEFLDGLASRVRFQAGRVVRNWLADVQLERLSGMGWTREAVRTVEHLLPSCVGGKALEERLVDWYITNTPRLVHSDEVLPLLEISESLLRRLSMRGASEVRDALARGALRTLELAFPTDQQQVRNRLERLVPGRLHGWSAGGMSAGRWAGWIAALVISIAFGAFVIWKGRTEANPSKAEAAPVQANTIEGSGSVTAGQPPAPDASVDPKSKGAVCDGLKLEASADGRFVLLRDAAAEPGSDSLSIFDLTLVKTGSNVPIWRMRRSEAGTEGESGTPLGAKRKEWSIGGMCLEPMPDNPDYRVDLVMDKEVCTAEFWHKSKVLYREPVRGLAQSESLCRGKLQVAWHWYYSTAYQSYLIHMVVDSYTEDYGELISLRNAFAFAAE